MFPAARVGDNHTCPCVTPGTPPVPHVGGPVIPPCSTNVQTNNQPQARGTDKLTCVGPPNFIVTGSATVLVNNLPAARQTSKTMHPPPGSIVVGSPNVLVGGPDIGVTLGNPAAGQQACGAAAAGRASHSTQQTYGNCAIESSRQIINRANGSNVSEEALLNSAISSGHANSSTVTSVRGGQSASDTAAVLTANGVPVTTQTQNMANIQQAVAEGRGVITGHDVSVLWGPGNTGGHAVTVTGIEYGPDGRPRTVIVNDTGRLPANGNCSVRYNATTFENSLDNDSLVVTNSRVW